MHDLFARHFSSKRIVNKFLCRTLVNKLNKNQKWNWFFLFVSQVEYSSSESYSHGDKLFELFKSNSNCYCCDISFHLIVEMDTSFELFQFNQRYCRAIGIDSSESSLLFNLFRIQLGKFDFFTVCSTIYCYTSGISVLWSEVHA